MTNYLMTVSVKYCSHGCLVINMKFRSSNYSFYRQDPLNFELDISVFKLCHLRQLTLPFNLYVLIGCDSLIFQRF